MKQTKKIALSSIMAALGTVFLSLGAIFEVMDLTVAALSSLIMVFVFIEIGSPFTYLTWIATSILTFVIFPMKPVSLEYFLIFGIYPIIKGYIDKYIPFLLTLPIKFLYFNGMFWLLYLVVTFLFGLPFFDYSGTVMKVVLYVISNVAFFVYDLFLKFSARVYFGIIRNKIKKYLK